MSPIRPVLRTAALIALVVAVAGASGCRWFRKDDPYAQSGENRPLELPPPLEQQHIDAANAGSGGSVTRSSLSAGGGAQRALGFTVAGDRAAVFERVGQALTATEGLTVVSRAQLLGAFDVDYEGGKFLVRVSEASDGSFVSAVDPRGLPAQGDPPAKLIAALKASLGGR